MSPEEFYPREYTDASRRVLDRFLEEFPEAILIGGWASWVRIGVLQSHDIDVIVSHETLPRIERRYGQLSVSTHIGARKWRGQVERVHLDVYVPYQSRLGSRLKLRVEELVPYAEVVDGRQLLAMPAHLATKFAALLDRPESLPGEKDRIEIWELLARASSPEEVSRVLRASDASGLEVVAAVRDVFVFLGDLELARTDRQRLRTLGAAFADAVDRVMRGL